MPRKAARGLYSGLVVVVYLSFGQARSAPPSLPLLPGILAQDSQLAEVWSAFDAAREVFRTDPQTGSEMLERLASRYPAHLASCLLNSAASLGLTVAREAEPEREQSLERRFLEAAAVALRRRGSADSLPKAFEAYVSGRDDRRELKEAWARLSDSVSRAGGGDLEGAGDETLDPFQESLATFKEVGNSLGIIHSLLASGQEKLRRDEGELASDDFRDAATAAHRAGDLWLEMRARAMQAKAEEQAGLMELAFGFYEDARELAEKSRDLPWQAETLRGAGRALMARGNPSLALDRFVAAIDIMRQDSGPGRDSPSFALSEAAEACALAAHQLADEGVLDKAAELVSRGLDYAREAGNETASARLLLVRADLFLSSGQRQKGIGLLRDGLEVFRRRADDNGMAAAASRLAGVLEEQLPGEAYGLYKEAAEAASAIGGDPRVGDFLARSADAARRAGLLQEAAQVLRIGLSEEWGGLSLEQADRLHLIEGNTALQAGDAAGALKSFAAVPGVNAVAREARWREGALRLRLGQPEAAANRLLAELPKDRIPPRALLACAFEALDRSGRHEESHSVEASIAGLLSDTAARWTGGSDWTGTNPAGSEDALAVQGLLDLRGGARSAAREAAEKLAASATPRALFDAASLFAALGEAIESDRALARARRLGLDPVLPILDPVLGR